MTYDDDKGGGFKMPFDNDQKGEGLNLCFIFVFWLPEYRTDIALGEGNTKLNSKIQDSDYFGKG